MFQWITFRLDCEIYLSLLSSSCFFSVVSSKNKDGTIASKSVKPQGSFVSHSKANIFLHLLILKAIGKSLENCFVRLKRKETTQKLLESKSPLSISRECKKSTYPYVDGNSKVLKKYQLLIDWRYLDVRKVQQPGLCYYRKQHFTPASSTISHEFVIKRSKVERKVPASSI